MVLTIASFFLLGSKGYQLEPGQIVSSGSYPTGLKVASAGHVSRTHGPIVRDVVPPSVGSPSRGRSWNQALLAKTFTAFASVYREKKTGQT